MPNPRTVPIRIGTILGPLRCFAHVVSRCRHSAAYTPRDVGAAPHPGILRAMTRVRRCCCSRVASSQRHVGPAPILRRQDCADQGLTAESPASLVGSRRCPSVALQMPGKKERWLRRPCLRTGRKRRKHRRRTNLDRHGRNRPVSTLSIFYRFLARFQRFCDASVTGNASPVTVQSSGGAMCPRWETPLVRCRRECLQNAVTLTV